jgi:hypothetical protein
VTVPSIPLGTGVSAGSGAQGTGGPSGSESVVLTYTLGSGTSTTIVTTTIRHTQVTTVYATQAAETGGAARISGNEAAAEQTDITTTITGTSTSTRYITVVPVSSGPSALGQVGASGLANNAASGETSCAPQVTVTVFQAVSTITVVSQPNLVMPKKRLTWTKDRDGVSSLQYKCLVG